MEHGEPAPSHIERIRERERHWQQEWAQAKAFESNPDEREKFFCTFPYPYVNGLPHVGHLFTIMRVESLARYMRLAGKNVLFPQAWHATGSPIAIAAKRVEEGDAKQIQILKDLGVTDEEIPSFARAEHWIEYFVPRYRQDLSAVGLSIDWRREFHTTSLNPHYDAFIRWQFTLLREKGHVQKGKHPVVWCPKDNAPVGDHDRREGEGETPQEFTLLKFPLKDDPQTLLIAATLRPETVFGQTNMWVAPDVEYVRAQVDEETWVVSEPCARKLAEQGKKVEIKGKVPGRSLIGKWCKAPGIDREIPVLPSEFCSPHIGSGIVTSVPSHASFDWIGLHDLQHDARLREKYGVPHELVERIEPIALISLEGWGEHPAKDICERMRITSQRQHSQLEEAKKAIYKEEHFKGVMKGIAGTYAGMRVEEAKEQVKDDLIAKGQADVMYELTGKVVCRCLTESIVKIVSDQWFLTYSDKEWKKQAREALAQLRLYPEKVRAQFDYVLGWLDDWACTREHGLGTRLPWDERWLIESLSDSTIYMSYYTIAHKIKDVPAELLTRELFDYVLLGKGTAPKLPHGIDAHALREEFLYWYPLDFRNSGKDLVQNHLSFMLFNHCAIFPKEHWPRGIGVNGWVTVNGQKMSKSLGNVIPVRNLVAQFGADATRITILNGGEGLDDPNWDSDFARAMGGKLDALIRHAQDAKEASGDGETPMDAWLRSRTNRIIKDVTAAMEETNFRTAIQLAFFEYGAALRWYTQRTRRKPNAGLLRDALAAQLVMLSPFVPHACEEAWRALGREGLVSLAPWPPCDESLIDERVEAAEEMVREIAESLRKDTQQRKPGKVTLYLAAQWKREAYARFDDVAARTRNPNEILRTLMLTPVGERGDELARLVRFLGKGRTPGYILEEKEERERLASALGYLSEEALGAEVEVREAGDGDSKKKDAGLPGRPAIELA